MLVDNKQVGCWFRFLQMRCSGLCPRRPRGWFGLLRVLSCGKHVRCGCCRVTSQKSFPIVCRRSVRCSLMLCLRLDGWFSWCRGQSSGKSASRQRAKKYQQSYERCSRDVQESHESQEPIDVHAKRAICDSRVVFNSPTCPCPRAACQIRLSVWGGAPPMSRLAGLEFTFCDISSLLGRINLSIFIHV